MKSWEEELRAPAAAVLIVLIIAVAISVSMYFFKRQNDANNLRNRVITACSGEPDPVKCSTDLVKAVKLIKS